jgi:hypothetical protein
VLLQQGRQLAGTDDFHSKSLGIRLQSGQHTQTENDAGKSQAPAAGGHGVKA